MIRTLLVIFWLGMLTVGYTYVGYGMIIYILSKLKRRSSPVTIQTDSELPVVTLLVAAYNEEAYILDKIHNTLALDYPKNKLKLFFVTDGSNDRTPEIIRNFPEIEVFHSPERRGKIHAVNRVMKHVSTPIVVFCDANTALNPEALKLIVRHYQDPTVGGVAGEKRILSKDKDNASGSGEGLYWKYESFLKKKDAEVHSIVGAAGELFSIRTELFEEPAENMLIEDFYLSLRIAAKGYRFAYEPEAFASETASASVGEEWKRKVRISAGGFQAMYKLSYLLNPFRYGILTFQYVSHRVLRWTLAPLFLPLILLSSVYLAIQGFGFYQMMFVAQVAFYLLAALGYALRDRKIGIKGFFVPYYFVVMNLSVYAGLVRLLRGRQSVVWEKAKRAEA
jgi:cellulose synthase/poly-beta-1,6-N-acetylglucosamine synthase-like glycosyltransferase